jgi:hypothetical protein
MGGGGEQVLPILFGLSHSQQEDSLVPFLKEHSLQAVISELVPSTFEISALFLHKAALVVSGAIPELPVNILCIWRSCWTIYRIQCLDLKT